MWTVSLSDVARFKDTQKKQIFISLAQETVLSGIGYRHARRITEEEEHNADKPLQHHIGAHHKKCDAKIKQNNVVRIKFRHSVTLQSRAFYAVLVLWQCHSARPLLI